MAESLPNNTASLPDQATLAELVATILTTAKQQGASASEAAVSCASGLSVSVRLGEVETLEHRRSRSLGVTVYFGQRKGSASTADWRTQAIRDTVQAACDIARHTAADDCAGLADPQRLARDIPDLDLFHSWDIDPETAIEQATQCEAAALDTDPRIRNSEGASLTTGVGLSYYGNSNQFSGGYASSRHSSSCSVIAEDAQGMQRNHWYSVARDHNALEPPESVGQRAAERALQRLGSQRLATRQAPVLFVPEMARGLLSHVIGAISGGALYRKSSFLVEHAGKAVFSPNVTLREQPHLTKALGSAPFDGEGVATQERDLVRDGVLQGYVLDSYAARPLGARNHR